MIFAIAFLFLAPSTALRVEGPLTLGDIALFLAVVAVVPDAVHQMQIRGPRRVPVWTWLPGLAVAVWGSIIVASLNLPSFLPLFVFVGTMVLVPTVVACYGATPRRLTQLMGAFVLGVVFNALAASLDALTPGSLTSRFTSDIEFGGDLRPPGFTTHSNQLGLLCGIAVPLVLHLFQNAETRLTKTVWAGSGLAVVLGAAASGSRGGLLAVLAGGAMWTVLAGGDVAKRGFLAVLGLAVAAWGAFQLGLTNGIDRLTGQRAASTSLSDRARVERAEAAFAEFSDHVWRGVGFSSGAAHNFYIEIARSGGILIFVMVLGGMLWVIASGWSLRRTVPLATPALCAVSVWTIAAVQHNATTARFIWIPAGLVAACWAIRRAQQAARPEVPAVRRAPRPDAELSPPRKR